MRAGGSLMARYPAGYSTMDYNFDFFNYAGIHRPVRLYTTPLALHIRWRRIRMTSSCRDITTSCLVAEDLSTASLQYSVEVELGAGGRVTPEGLQCTVHLVDGDQVVGGGGDGAGGGGGPLMLWPH